MGSVYTSVSHTVPSTYLVYTLVGVKIKMRSKTTHGTSVRSIDGIRESFLKLLIPAG